MPAAPAKDQAIAEQCVTTLNKIAVGPTEWLTSPAKPITEAQETTRPDDSAELQLWLAHDMTKNTDEDAGGLGMHNRTFVGAVAIFARADVAGGRRKKIREAATDVLRAFYADEGVFYALTGDAGIRLGDLRFDTNPESAWFGCGILDLTAQFESSHSAP